MNLEEGFHNSWKREGVQEALDSGEVVTKEDYLAVKKSIVSDAVNTVRLLMKEGFSLDKSLEFIEEELKDSVREQILREQQS